MRRFEDVHAEATAEYTPDDWADHHREYAAEGRRIEAADLAADAWVYAERCAEQQHPHDDAAALTTAENIYLGAIWMRNRINGPTKEDTA